MKLTTITNVSVDGVVQGLGGRTGTAAVDSRAATRLFPGTGPGTARELVDSRSTPKGVTIQVYRPSGVPAVRTATT